MNESGEEKVSGTFYFQNHHGSMFMWEDGWVGRVIKKLRTGRQAHLHLATLEQSILHQAFTNHK